VSDDDVLQPYGNETADSRIRSLVSDNWRLRQEMKAIIDSMGGEPNPDITPGYRPLSNKIMRQRRRLRELEELQAQHSNEWARCRAQLAELKQHIDKDCTASDALTRLWCALGFGFLTTAVMQFMVPRAMAMDLGTLVGIVYWLTAWIFRRRP